MQFDRYLHFLWQPLHFVFVYIDVPEVEVHMFISKHISMQCIKMYFCVSINVYMCMWKYMYLGQVAEKT